MRRFLKIRHNILSFKTQITQSYKSSLHHLDSSSRSLLGIPPPGARAFDMELRLGKNEGGKAWPLWAHGWKSFKFFPGGFPKLHDFVCPPIRTNQRGDLVKVGLEWLSHWCPSTKNELLRNLLIHGSQGSEERFFSPNAWKSCRKLDQKRHLRFELLRQWISCLTSTCSETTHLISLTNI